MRKVILIFTVTFFIKQVVFGQGAVQGSREYQRLADAYYLNKQAKENAISWNWLFGSSNSSYNWSNVVVNNSKEGDWYAGHVDSNGDQSGYGTMKFGDNNSFYSGKWKDGYMHGVGTLHWSSGSIFSGQFKKGNRDGFGIYKWSGGNSYIGQWKENKKDGFGIQQWPIGNSKDKSLIKYLGEYKNDVRYGYGIKYYEDGSYESGIWIEDVLSKEVPKLEVLEMLGF